jgi:hypothetical protein
MRCDIVLLTIAAIAMVCTYPAGVALTFWTDIRGGGYLVRNTTWVILISLLNFLLVVPRLSKRMPDSAMKQAKTISFQLYNVDHF